MSTPDKNAPFTEKIEVAGDQLVSKVRELVKDGSAKRVIIKDQHGKELLTIPLNMGVAAGGLVTLAAPGLAALGAVAALVAKVQLEIERVHPEDNVPEAATDSSAGATGTQVPVGETPTAGAPSATVTPDATEEGPKA